MRALVLASLACGCLALRPALRPAFQRRPLVMCEEPVQDPKAALKQLQPVVEAKQGEGAAYLQQLMKLTNNPEKNDELLEQVPERQHHELRLLPDPAQQQHQYMRWDQVSSMESNAMPTR